MFVKDSALNSMLFTKHSFPPLGKENWLIIGKKLTNINNLLSIYQISIIQIICINTCSFKTRKDSKNYILN